MEGDPGKFKRREKNHPATRKVKNRSKRKPPILRGKGKKEKLAHIEN